MTASPVHMPQPCYSLTGVRLVAGSPGAAQRGMALIVVLVVVSLLSLAALTFSQLMVAEREATLLSGRRLQARALADSGVDYMRWFMMQDEITLLESGGYYNNELEFSGMLVMDDADPHARGRFAIVSPNVENGYFSGIRYGLEDESTKLNLNALAKLEEEEQIGGDILMLLPGMTEDIADAILDWIDADGDTREFGAELDYYSALVPPYEPKNGPLDSIDELLLVRDVTPSLLYGVDANRNTNADSTEPDGLSMIDVDNTDGSLDRGWSAYLTVHSYENNTNAEGEAKINLNQDDLEALHKELKEALSDDWAAFIVGYRQNGEYSGSDQPGATPTSGIDFKAEGSRKLDSILDLVGIKTQVTMSGDNREPVILAPILEENSGSLEQELPVLLDTVTLVDAETISGRININQAARAVLLTIPELSAETADQIIANRISDPQEADEDQTCPMWPLTRGVVDVETMKSIERYVCTGGNIYRAQVVGYFDGGGPAARIEVVFDATQSPAAILSWKDISHLGRGYPLEMLGIDTTIGGTLE